MILKQRIICSRRIQKGVLVASAAALVMCNAYSDEITNKAVDFVVFFKQAISSPPDVERFVAAQRDLQSAQSNVFQCFQGASSGTNYFLSVVSSSNSLADMGKSSIIAGRSGASTYQIAGNILTHGIGSNGLTFGVNMLYIMTRQLLGMGAAEIEPKSVVWAGDEFTAKNSSGASLHGRLVISNGLPFRLEVGLASSASPYKVIGYTYPAEAGQLSGFPSTILISAKDAGLFVPSVEVVVHSIQISGTGLAANYFDDSKFTNNYKYLNMRSNSDYYIYNKGVGGLVLAPGSVMESGGYTNSRSRAFVYFFLIIITIIPLVILTISLFRKTKTK